MICSSHPVAAEDRAGRSLTLPRVQPDVVVQAWPGRQRKLGVELPVPRQQRAEVVVGAEAGVAHVHEPPAPERVDGPERGVLLVGRPAHEQTTAVGVGAHGVLCIERLDGEVRRGARRDGVGRRDLDPLRRK